MDEAKIRTVQSSFWLALPRMDDVVNAFYQRLFEVAPGVRALFPDDLKKQKAALKGALVLAVSNLRSPDTLMPTLADMGKRHVDYGAAPEHYPVVRDVMLEVMAEEIPGWNDEAHDAWTAALNAVATAMIEGAAVTA